MARPDDDDLDAWLDGLRGRAAPGASAATRDEARRQRAAVVDAHAAQRAAQPDDPQELQRLLFRLRREGLLGAAVDAPAGARAPARWRLPLAAAAMLALGLAVTMVGPELWRGGEEPVLRSGAAVQVLEVDASAVAETAQRLQSALQGVDAAVAISEAGEGAREVAATVPKDRLSDAARALAPFGLAPPAADGTLRVEVRARTTPVR